jgi:hypothetical protein
MRYFSKAVFAAMLAAAPAHAATFEASAPDGHGDITVNIVGKFLPGDGIAFEAIVEKVKGKGVIFFSSRGGSLAAGLAIGDAIRRHGFGTAVIAGKECYSACAIAWLAGDLRFTSPTSRIGFHAAYDGKGVSSSANAVIGAYLNQLGFEIPTIAYITETDPDDIRYLSRADALRYGIDVVIVDDNGDEDWIGYKQPADDDAEPPPQLPPPPWEKKLPPAPWEKHG